MENEKKVLNEAENSSSEKVIAPDQLENGVVAQKDPGGFAIPDPDAHLSVEEKAAIVSFPRWDPILGAKLTRFRRTRSSFESWIGL